jgi:hypothetical protein
MKRLALFGKFGFLLAIKELKRKYVLRFGCVTLLIDDAQ